MASLPGHASRIRNATVGWAPFFSSRMVLHLVFVTVLKRNISWQVAGQGWCNTATPRSPDLTPLGFLCGVVKFQLYTAKITTIAEFNGVRIQKIYKKIAHILWKMWTKFNTVWMYAEPHVAPILKPVTCVGLPNSLPSCAEPTNSLSTVPNHSRKSMAHNETRCNVCLNAFLGNYSLRWSWISFLAKKSTTDRSIN